MTNCKTSEMSIHLLKLFMGRNWSAHERLLMKCSQRGSVLHLDEVVVKGSPVYTGGIRHAVSRFLTNLDNFLPLDEECYKFVLLWNSDYTP